MCGIAGLLGDFGENRHQLKQMLDTMFHRGPDEQGVYFDNYFSGGMRRLSINDVSGGSQPLYSKDKNVIVFYNGEIYNSKKLKHELVLKGKIFRTESDGEVIAHLYEDIGELVFEKLDGMFAIAIWDVQKKRLLLARDSAGEKPLYYMPVKDNELVFASEVKAIKSLSSLSITLNRKALWDFSTFLWIPEPSTAYNEILSLPRGSFLIADSSGISVKSFHSETIDTSIADLSDRSVIELTRHTVEESIKSRLLSDVPVGSFLSGGLDSSIISAIASRELKTLDTFTVSFENIRDPYHGHADESEAALLTAAILGTNHHTVSVTADSMRADLDDFVKFGDLPFGVSSGLGILAISKAAKEAGIKVLLSGDGADECFGGYSWYEHIVSMKNSQHKKYDNKAISFQNVGISLKDRVKAIERMSPNYRGWAWHYYAHESEKNLLFNKEWSSDLLSSIRYFDTLNKNDSAESFIKHDRDFYFPNEMLRKVDRMTMAHSVEGRAPFASRSIIALANNLKSHQMVKGKNLKWVLRKAFEDILPMEIINRPKHGFNVPIDHWLNDSWSDLVEESFSTDSELYKHGMISKDSYLVAKKCLETKNV